MAPKWLKSIPYLWPKRLKNHTLWGRKYQYSLLLFLRSRSYFTLSAQFFDRLHRPRVWTVFIGRDCQFLISPKREDEYIYKKTESRSRTIPELKANSLRRERSPPTNVSRIRFPDPGIIIMFSCNRYDKKSSALTPLGLLTRHRVAF